MHRHCSPEKFRDSKGTAAASLMDFENGAAVFASSLERDTISGGAGIPLSNSRTLAIDGMFAAPQTGILHKRFIIV